MELVNALIRLKAIADIGLVHTIDNYDKERYVEIQSIVFELMSQISNQPLPFIQDFFKEAVDYPTPKVDIRALVLNEKSQILLVQEGSDSKWALPGGWADIGFSPAEVAVKEVWEETGLRVKVDRLLAVFDKKSHPHPHQAIYVYKLAFLCTYLEGNFKKSFDILDVGFFDVDRLPPLSENRILASQIHILLEQLQKNMVYFD